MYTYTFHFFDGTKMNISADCFQDAKEKLLDKYEIDYDAEVEKYTCPLFP